MVCRMLCMPTFHGRFRGNLCSRNRVSLQGRIELFMVKTPIALFECVVKHVHLYFHFLLFINLQHATIQALPIEIDFGAPVVCGID